MTLDGLLETAIKCRNAVWKGGWHGYVGIYMTRQSPYDLCVNWKDYIVADPEVLGGKPTIEGTRISVEFIIQRLAQGRTENELLENCPRLTPKHLQAIFAYLQECMEDGLLISY